MPDVWTDENGFKRYHDDRGWCWRWDAYADDSRGGWVRDAKFDKPDRDPDPEYTEPAQ